MLEAIFLGIVQGLTEFLPISSSAHIRIIGGFWSGAEDPGATFTAITQIGTEIAVLIYFRKSILAIVRAWSLQLTTRKFKADASATELADAKLGNYILLGSIPIVIVGYIFQDTIRTTFRSLWLVAIVLIVFGIILGAADAMGSRVRKLENLTARHTMLYGLAQCLALIPGVSRSGATISMGRILGYEREDALRYSFFLAIPAVLGSGFFELKTALTDPSVTELFTMSETLVATAVAFAVGYAVIAWLMRFISTKSFRPFVIYRICLGVALIIALSTGVISA